MKGTFAFVNVVFGFLVHFPRFFFDVVSSSPRASIANESKQAASSCFQSAFSPRPLFWIKDDHPPGVHTRRDDSGDVKLPSCAQLFTYRSIALLEEFRLNVTSPASFLAFYGNEELGLTFLANDQSEVSF